MKYLISFIMIGLLSTQAFAAEIGLVSAAETIPRGSLLEEIDLIISKGSSRNALEPFLGQETTRTIYAGATLRLRDVRSPILVRRNARVAMIYRFKGLEISAAGRALGPGSNGDTIEILNLESRKRVEGRVSGLNRVEMQP
jgi:flagella basal body P-ring formation protein FlgA